MINCQFFKITKMGPRLLVKWQIQ